MEMGEGIAIGGLDEELALRCPFQDDALGVDSVEPEAPSKDELKAVEREQDNDGGVLGRNLGSASNGAEGTVGGPFPPPEARATLRRDTKRTGLRVKVPGTSAIPEGVYGLTVAAHHLIPGEASLEPSALKPYLTMGESVEVDTGHGKKTKKIRRHIGYNVNGAHNGAWLPGNYYIRAATSPIAGKSWSELGDDPWCLNYVAAVTKASGGQFHDAHPMYSAAVKDLLGKIALALVHHECDACRPPDVNPPFLIKDRLYRLSGYLRTQVTGPPAAWKRPWFTSDRWRDSAFSTDKPSEAFLSAYAAAEVVTSLAPSGGGR